MRRAALAALFVALAACSAEPPSGATPVPTSTPAPSPTPSLGAPLPFEGAYELSISLDGACAREFPGGLRVRRYPVRVIRGADRSTLALEIDNYTTPGWPAPDPPGAISVDGTGTAQVRFAFNEILSQTPVPGQPNFVRSEEFQVRGSTTAVIGAGRLDGNFSGELTYWRDTAVPPPIACASDRHDFSLRPR